jgi:2-hydroxy-6-oxonona-2,4-dienedioate hydrolase
MKTARKSRGSQETLAVVDGLRTYARVSEDRAAGGPPVVLVHGLVVSGRYLGPLLNELARSYAVYAPDLPGFGRSEGPAGALDVVGLADALAAWMRATGLRGAVLVGNSMGCQVIVELVLRHPDLVEKVVLQGPTMDPRARSAPRQMWRLLIDTTREPPSLVAIEGLDLLRASVRGSWRTFRHSLDYPIEERLPRVHVPALVVHGSRDRISPRYWAEEVARLLPDGRLVELPGTPHAANYSAPAEFARAVRAFLAGGLRHSG